MEKIPIESPVEKSPSLGSRITEKLKSGLEKLKPKKVAKKLGATALSVLGVRSNYERGDRGSLSTIERKDKGVEKKDKKKSKIARAIGLLFGRSDKADREKAPNWTTEAKLSLAPEDNAVQTAQTRTEKDTNSEVQKEFEADLEQDKKIGFVASYLATRSIDKAAGATQTQESETERQEPTDSRKTPEIKLEATAPPVVAEASSPRQETLSIQNPNLESATTTPDYEKNSQIQENDSESLPTKVEDLDKTNPRFSSSELKSEETAVIPGTDRAEQLQSAVARTTAEHKNSTIALPQTKTPEQALSDTSIERFDQRKPEVETYSNEANRLERESLSSKEVANSAEARETESAEAAFELEAEKLEGEQLIHNPEFLKKRLDEELKSSVGSQAGTIEQLRTYGMNNRRHSKSDSGHGRLGKLIGWNPKELSGAKVAIITVVTIVVVLAIIAIVGVTRL